MAVSCYMRRLNKNDSRWHHASIQSYTSDTSELVLHLFTHIVYHYALRVQGPYEEIFVDIQGVRPQREILESATSQ